MRLWRLSGADFAERFDGGYGLHHDGRSNLSGHPVTYCATGPALCVLEKLVHLDDALLLPDDTMLVCYDVPDDVAVQTLHPQQVPDGWRDRPNTTQSIGTNWLQGTTACLLAVPSAVVPVWHADDRNVLVNHKHRDAGRISILRTEPFEFDPRLFSSRG